jgi:arylsulfatase A-like enzyme
MYLGMDTILAGTGFARLEDAGDIGGNRNSSFGVDEPAAVRRILQWVDSLPRGRPFLAAYLPIAGHHPYPYEKPGPFPEETEIDRYRSALYDGDRALGVLLAGLRRRGLADSTLIVVIGDHGEAFGQHSGNYGHTLAIYEENVRVPFTILIPGTENAALRVRRTASLLDVAPTILDMLGLDPPPAFQGVSLLEPQPRMALFFTDYSLGLLGLRDGCTKYIHEMESGRSRMFDLCRDPSEQDDLAAQRAAEAGRYRDRLRRWIAAEVARVGG